MRVSIVLSLYRNAATMRETVDSLLAQTFSDFELLLVDDASPDESGAIADEYAALDPRVRVLRNPTNLGLAASLRRAAEEARGEYIVRIDGDDVARVDRVEIQVGYLDRHPEIGAVGSLYSLFTGDLTKTWTDPGHDAAYRADGIRHGRPPFPHPTVCFRRSLIDQFGNYDPSYDGAEDHELFGRWYAAGVRYTVLPERLIAYRIHASSTTSARSQHVIRTSLRVNLRMLYHHRIRFTLRGYRYVLMQFGMVLFGRVAGSFVGRQRDLDQGSSRS